MIKLFRGILRVKYRIPILLFFASIFIFGVWLLMGPTANRSAENHKIYEVSIAGGTVDEAESDKAYNAWGIDLICGSIITLASFVAAIYVIGMLPTWETEFRANQRWEERRRQDAPMHAARSIEFRRSRDEAAERSKLRHAAEWERSKLRHTAEFKEETERDELKRVHLENVGALEKEIRHKKQDVLRKIQIEELTGNAQTVEENVKAEIVREREEFLRRMALKAAEEDLILKREEASQHLTDRQIEQIVLRAFRRISSLASSEQDDAWDEWGADIAAEYDEYVTGEILAQAQELRNE